MFWVLSYRLLLQCQVNIILTGFRALDFSPCLPLVGTCYSILVSFPVLEKKHKSLVQIPLLVSFSFCLRGYGRIPFSLDFRKCKKLHSIKFLNFLWELGACITVEMIDLITTFAFNHLLCIILNEVHKNQTIFSESEKREEYFNKLSR